MCALQTVRNKREKRELVVDLEFPGLSTLFCGAEPFTVGCLLRASLWPRLASPGPAATPPPVPFPHVAR